MARRTLAAGFTDTRIEKAAAKSAPAGKNEISVNPVILSDKKPALISVNPRLISLRALRAFVVKKQNPR